MLFGNVFWQQIAAKFFSPNNNKVTVVWWTSTKYSASKTNVTHTKNLTSISEDFHSFGDVFMNIIVGIDAHRNNQPYRFMRSTKEGNTSCFGITHDWTLSTNLHLIVWYAKFTNFSLLCSTRDMSRSCEILMNTAKPIKVVISWTSGHNGGKSCDLLFTIWSHNNQRFPIHWIGLLVCVLIKWCKCYKDEV